MTEHLVSDVAFSRLSPCKIKRVIFFNNNAAAQSLAFSYGSMPSTDARFSLHAAANSPANYDLDGLLFLQGFTCTPSSGDISDIIIEVEDIKT